MADLDSHAQFTGSRDKRVLSMYRGESSGWSWQMQHSLMAKLAQVLGRDSPYQFLRARLTRRTPVEKPIDIHGHR
ncbi:hypothetical protein [Cryobacterium sp. N22]|uniref:hypothetical protein n=1 Tax=Cryobacterium sp. N22 TaxID=2048290 RepID=UPI000CE4B5F6|nr:hypothetical protein [Cryobacterium sp. N22]